MNFFIVYIKEAHPIDGWRTRGNDRAGIKVKQPKTEKERLKVAQTACKALKFTVPTLIDDMKNSTNGKYFGWPDRLFVVGHDGKMAYSGERGPFGFNPRTWEDGIKKAIAKAPRKKAAKRTGDGQSEDFMEPGKQ